MPRKFQGDTISDRALNRATLARQGLLARQAISAADMLTHLIGLQGQVHNAPHVGLWSRLAKFSSGDLEALLKDRVAVRATLMRCTLHVASAEDFLAIRPLIDPVALRGFNANHRKPLGDADVSEVRAASRELLDKEALSPAALGKKLQRRWPEANAIALSMAARFLEPVVHVPPAGLWGATRPPELISARRWLGRNPGEPISLETLVLRYLRAFGPASPRDFGAWSGISGAAAVFERLRPQLLPLTGQDGRELFDLPEAPRPSADTPAPVRLLPEYDNVLFGYDERGRMMTPEGLKGLWRANGFRPAFTVDGVVRGCWKLEIGAAKAKLALSWFEPLRQRDEAELRREAAALLRALVPDRAAEISIAAFAGAE